MDDIKLFGAITLDTSILEKQGYKFNEGLLKQLRQFLDSPVKLVQTDIVHQEAKKHICACVKDYKQKVDNILRTAPNQIGIPLEKVEEAKELLSLNDDISIIAEKRLQKYYEQTGAELLETDKYVDVQRLLKLYFDTEAPFEDRKDKKSEFPDAIALISLDVWAEDNCVKGEASGRFRCFFSSFMLNWGKR